MYELDHLLNGKQSSQHHQGLIKQAKYDHMVRNVKPAPEKRQSISPLRAIYTAVMHIIWSI